MSANQSLFFAQDEAEYLYSDDTDMNIASGGDLLVNLTGGNLAPSADDGAALGISGQAFSDLFLANEAVINFNAGNYTMTHSDGLLTLNNSLTLSDGDITVSGGDFDVGTDADDGASISGLTTTVDVFTITGTVPATNNSIDGLFFSHTLVDSDTSAALNIDLNNTDNATAADTIYGLYVNMDDNSTSSDDVAYNVYLNNEDGVAASHAMLALNNADGDTAVATGIEFLAGGAGTDFTDGIDFSSANLTRELVLENGEAIINQTDDTFTFEDDDGTDYATLTVSALTFSGTSAMTMSLAADNGAGENFSITGMGGGTGNVVGGLVAITGGVGGTGGAAGAGGAATLTGGAAGAVGATGGSVAITGGASSDATGKAGNVTITTGARTGGTNGHIALTVAGAGDAGEGAGDVAVEAADQFIVVTGADGADDVDITGSVTMSGDLLVSGGDITGANGNAIDIGEATDGTMVFSRDDAGTVTLTAADSDANAALALTGGGTENVSLVVDADSEISISATGVPTADLISFNNVGGALDIATDAVDFLSIGFEAADGSNMTNSAINLNLHNNGTAAGDTMYGLQMDLAAAGSGTNSAIKINSTAAWSTILDTPTTDILGTGQIETTPSSNADFIAFTGTNLTTGAFIDADLSAMTSGNVIDVDLDTTTIDTDASVISITDSRAHDGAAADSVYYIDVVASGAFPGGTGGTGALINLEYTGTVGASGANSEVYGIMADVSGATLTAGSMAAGAFVDAAGNQVVIGDGTNAITATGIVTVSDDLTVTDNFSVDGIMDFGTLDALGDDTTPNVAGAAIFTQGAVTGNVTEFPDPVAGQVWIINHTGATTYDCDNTDGGDDDLDCGGADVVVGAADTTMWYSDGTVSYLISWVDEDDNQGGGADLAEWYASQDSLGPADLVVIDRNNPENVALSTEARSADVVGAISTQPWRVMGQGGPGKYAVALTGNVPVKVTNENGQIEIGDYLTSASRPGFAMKADAGDPTIGMALTALVVNVLVSRNNGSQVAQLQDAGGIESLGSGDVTVSEHLYASSDAAGRAVVLAGDTYVDVEFAEEYQYQPIVNATQRSTFNIPGYWYVTEESTTGFRIQLDGTLGADTEFNWMAVGVEEGVVSVSDGSTRDIEIYILDGVLGDDEPAEEEAPAEEPAEEEAPAEEPAE